MFKFCDLLEKNSEELVMLEAMDSGKTVHSCRSDDIPATIDCFRYYAGWADKIHGLTIPMNGPFIC